MFQWCYRKKSKSRTLNKNGMIFENSMQNGWFLLKVECFKGKLFQSKMHRWEKEKSDVSLMLDKEKWK